MTGEVSKTTRKSQLYIELHKAHQAGDHEKLIKSSNRILHEFPEEITAFECKIISCIHLSRFQDALEFIGKNPKLSGNLGYEKAYCLYRLNQTNESKQVLEETKENSLRKKELLCQILYRLEKFEECFELYKEVIKNSNDDYEEERQTNLVAIASFLAASKSTKTVPVTKGTTFEHQYNYGCHLVSGNKFVEAELVLNEAENTCTEFLREDGLADEEIEDELSIIRAQKAYCSQRLGRNKEALRLNTAILKVKPSDIGVLAVVSNNVLSMNRDQNIFESKKRIKAMNTEGIEFKLTQFQKKRMLINQCLFYLLTNQLSSCEETYKKLYDEFPNDCEEALCLETSRIAKAKGIDEAYKLIMDNRVKKIKGLDLKIKLGLVQTSLKEGKRSVAIDLLKKLAEGSFPPGIVGALVTLYQADGNMKDANALLQQAVNFYKNSGEDKRNMSLLWRQAASLMMAHGQFAEAVKSLEDLRKLTDNDVVTVAQLIVAYAQHDRAKAKQLSFQLPSIQPAQDLDIDAIEAPNWLASLKNIKKTTKAESEPTSPKTGTESASATNLKVKKKKKRKTKLPKNFEPDRKPDPERWLPRYERMGFKPKRTKKSNKSDVGKGTQGAASEFSEALDMSKMASRTTSQTTVESSPAPVGSSGKKTGKKRRSKK